MDIPMSPFWLEIFDTVLYTGRSITWKISIDHFSEALSH